MSRSNDTTRRPPSPDAPAAKIRPVRDRKAFEPEVLDPELEAVLEEPGDEVADDAPDSGEDPKTLLLGPDGEEVPEQEGDRFAPTSAGDLAGIDVKKICRSCGKNLKGHRRYKDSRGYICVACDRDDKARRVPCAECGKPTLPESLRPFGPVSICVRCYADHEADPKLRARRRVSTRHFDLYERRNVLMVAGVALVLLLLILYGMMT